MLLNSLKMSFCGHKYKKPVFRFKGNLTFLWGTLLLSQSPLLKAPLRQKVKSFLIYLTQKLQWRSFLNTLFKHVDRRMLQSSFYGCKKSLMGSII